MFKRQTKTNADESNVSARRPVGNSRLAAYLAGALLVAAAGLWNLQSHGPVQAEVREGSHEMFKSGGARSELVLKDMHETLKQIDRRLERFENAMRAAAQQQQQQQQAAPPPALGP
jgi:hypothetical protein